MQMRAKKLKLTKLLAVVLSITMLLPILAVPVSAEEIESIVVHYFNENNWENPYIYYYNGSNEGKAWPGEQMSLEGDGWYQFEIQGYSTANVIFSNKGADQNPAQNPAGFEVSGEMWYYKGNFTTSKPEIVTTTVHYYNENNWAEPYIYYYTDDNSPVSWPGTKMTSEGGNWYYYTITDMAAPKVIFSDKGNNQYPAANQEGLSVNGEQ